MRGSLCAALFGAFIAIPGTALAQPAIEFPSAVAAFEQYCLIPGVDPKLRVAALAGGAGWTVTEDLSVDVEKFEISKATAANYDFSKITTATEFRGVIDGANASFILAEFAGNPRYKHLCALVMTGAKIAMPYGGALRDAFKRYGVSAKSVDLVHYYEFAGKVGPNKHPVRGEIFSRSQVRPDKETLHIYLAY